MYIQQALCECRHGHGHSLTNHCLPLLRCMDDHAVQHKPQLSHTLKGDKTSHCMGTVEAIFTTYSVRTIVVAVSVQKYCNTIKKVSIPKYWSYNKETSYI